MGLLSGITVMVVDTETTGFRVGDGHRLVEVACVTVTDGRVADSWSSLVNPGRPIPPDATKVHQITDAMVAGAPGVAEIGRELRGRLPDVPLVFHNAPFDLPFLAHALQQGGAAPLTQPILDTLGLARDVYGVGNNKLESVAAGFGVKPQNAHRALGDAMMTAQMLPLLVAEWERQVAAQKLKGPDKAGVGARSFGEMAARSQAVVAATSRRGLPRARCPIRTSR
jgi:DNA polymerase-3 subunit epsilon